MASCYNKIVKKGVVVSNVVNIPGLSLATFTGMVTRLFGNRLHSIGWRKVFFL